MQISKRRLETRLPRTELSVLKGKSKRRNVKSTQLGGGGVSTDRNILIK